LSSVGGEGDQRTTGPWNSGGRIGISGLFIIDNLLILAHDYHDLYDKVVLVVRHCIKHNVFLKFEKPFLGVKSVKFFGFECTKSSFKITDERKQQIQQIPRPMTKKGMQSLLGTTVICSKFIPNSAMGVGAGALALAQSVVVEIAVEEVHVEMMIIIASELVCLLV